LVVAIVLGNRDSKFGVPGNGGGAKPIANDTGGDNARNHFVFI